MKRRTFAVTLAAAAATLAAGKSPLAAAEA